MTPPLSNSSSPEWIEIGKIVGAQGLKGEVRIYPDSDFPERFVQPGQRWLLRPGAVEPQAVQLEAGRFLTGKGLFVVKLAEVNDRTAAEALRDSTLLVPASDRPVLEADEFHVLDLLGLAVVDQGSQEAIGVVVDVLTAGNDLLEVRLHQPNGKALTVLIPFVKAIVPVVDLAEKRLEITPPPGLID